MLMDPNERQMKRELAELDIADIVARKDQSLAAIRQSAQYVNAYLEGLENENIEDPLRSQLVRDFASEFWRRHWDVAVDDAADGRDPHD